MLVLVKVNVARQGIDDILTLTYLTYLHSDAGVVSDNLVFVNCPIALN